MITVNGLCAGGMEGVGKWVDEFSVDGGDGKRLSSKFSFLFLTEEAVTTEAGGLFQYFTTPTENADPLLRQWLAP